MTKHTFCRTEPSHLAPALLAISLAALTSLARTDVRAESEQPHATAAGTPAIRPDFHTGDFLPESINIQGASASEKHGRVLTTIAMESLAVAPIDPVEPPPPETSAPESPSEVVRRAVQQEIDAGLFPGAVLLVGRPGQVLYHDAFGHARIVPEKVAMGKDFLFDLASVTKVVATATAFGVCVDDGTLRFGMFIGQALPTLTGGGINQITVDQLATHTSGFDNTKYHRQVHGEAMLDLMLHASPQWKPGSRYYYSCLNIWIDPEKQVYVIVLTNRNHPRMVGGQRKTQQYEARARIGDAARACQGF